MRSLGLHQLSLNSPDLGDILRALFMIIMYRACISIFYDNFDVFRARTQFFNPWNALLYINIIATALSQSGCAFVECSQNTRCMMHENMKIYGLYPRMRERE